MSVFSSKWGEYLGTVPADHFDLNRPRTSPSSIVSPIQNAISSISTTIASSIVPDGAKSQKDDYLLQYQHRINQVLNHLGGPNSFDDYLYGQDYLNTHDKWAQCTLDENSIAGINGEDGSFDVAKFYLGVMNRLFKDGY